MTETALTQRSTDSLTTSPRAMSGSRLQAAIHSPHDAGEVLKTLNAMLYNHYVPDGDDETKARARELFMRALAGIPTWACLQAIDVWSATRVRRPSPAELVEMCHAAMKPISTEIKYRKMVEDRQQEERAAIDLQRPTKEQAQKIVDDAGFTVKRMQAVRARPMATTFAEAEESVSHDVRPHWSETRDPDGPEWAGLKKARDDNPMIQQARASARQIAKQANPMESEG